MARSRKTANAARLLARAALGAAGVLAIVWLVREAGAHEVRGAFRKALPWLPLAALLEGARIVCEATATRSFLGRDARRVPVSDLLRMHLIGYSVCIVMPAGRAVAEAGKATMLAPYVGAPKGAAVGVANQVSSLVADAIAGAIGLLVALRLTGASVLSGSLALHVAVCSGAALFIRIVTRGRALERLLQRFTKLRTLARTFREASHEQQLFPPGPIAALTAARVGQMALFAVLLHALGLSATPARAIVAQSLSLLAAAAGDMVPAQLGVTDGAFVVSADLLGTTAATALSMSVIFHCLQLFWVATGALLPLAWRPVAQPAHNGAA